MGRRALRSDRVRPGQRQRPDAEGALNQFALPLARLARVRGQSIALGAGLDDVAVEGHPVDDGRDQSGIGDHLAPFGERQVRADGDRCLLLALGQDLEQQLGPSGVELDITELVDQEQVESSIAGDQSGQSAFVLGFDQFVDQSGAGDVAHPLAQLARGQTHADQEMALAGPRVAQQDDRLAPFEIAARGQQRDGLGVDPRIGRHVEVSQTLDARKAGLGDPSAPAALGPFVDFGGQHVGQIAEMADPVALGRFSQAGRFGPDDREPQLPGGRPDGSHGGGVGDLGHELASSSSS